MQEHVDYLEFLVRLRRLVEQHATATLQVMTDDRHFVNIGLSNGRIAALYHGPKRGRRAIDDIRRFSGGALTILTAMEYRPQPDLPTTQEILHLLDNGSLDRFAAATASTTRAEPLPSSAPAPQPYGATASELVINLHHVERTLTEFIGPIASLVMQDAMRSLGQLATQNDLVRLADILSIEIGDPEQARKFVQQALRPH